MKTKMNKHVDIVKYINNLIIAIIIVISTLAIVGDGADIIKLSSFENAGGVRMTFSSAILALCSALICMTDRKLKCMKFTLVVSLVLTCIYIYTSWLINNSKPVFLPLFSSDKIIDMSRDLPSYGTIVGFIIFGLNAYVKSKYMSLSILVIGVAAFVGHAMNIPTLYFKLSEYPTGVAINTALVFMLLSIYQRINLKN